MGAVSHSLLSWTSRLVKQAQNRHLYPKKKMDFRGLDFIITGGFINMRSTLGCFNKDYMAMSTMDHNLSKKSSQSDDGTW